MAGLPEIVKAWEASGRDKKELKTRLLETPEEKRPQVLDNLSQLFELDVSEPQEFPRNDPRNPGFTPDEEVQEPTFINEFTREATEKIAERPVVLGAIAEGTVDQAKRFPDFKEKLEQAEQENPIETLAGRVIGFAVGPAKLFKPILKGVKGITKAGQKILKLKKGAQKARIVGDAKKAAKLGAQAKGVEGRARTGAAVVEAGVVETARKDQDIESAAQVTGIVGGIGASLNVLGSGGRFAARLINPKFMAGLQNAKTISKKGAQNVIANSSEQALEEIGNVQANMAEKVASATDDVADAVDEVVGGINSTLNDASESVANAVSQKLGAARDTLNNTVTAISDSINGARLLVNQRYGASLDNIIAKTGNKTIHPKGVADEMKIVLREQGIMLGDRLNTANPFVESSPAFAKELIRQVKRLDKGSFTLKELNAIKQQIGELANFGANPSARSLGFKRMYGKLADLLESEVPEFGRLNKTYAAQRRVIDDAMTEFGGRTDTVVGKLEQISKSGKAAGKKSSAEKTLKELGKLDPRAQAQVNKGLKEAQEVIDLHQLDLADAKKVQSTVKGALFSKKPINQRQLQNLKKKMGQLSEIDDIAEQMRKLDGIPGIKGEDLLTKDGQVALRNWARTNSPQSLNRVNKLIRQVKRQKKLDPFFKATAGETEQAVFRSLNASETKALRMLVRMEPKLNPILDDARMAKFLEESGQSLGDVRSLGDVGKLILTAPNVFVKWAKSIGIKPATAERIHRAYLGLVQFTSRGLEDTFDTPEGGQNR